MKRLAAAMMAGAATMALGGCGGVTSPKPLFGAEDMSLAQLKPGVWIGEDGACSQPSQPTPGAPRCSVDLVITATEIRPTAAEVKGAKGDGSEPSELVPKITYILGSGEPLIVQVGLDVSAIPNAPKMPAVVMFMALKPLEQGADGQITRAEMWGVECGRRPEGTPDEAVDEDGEPPAVEADTAPGATDHAPGAPAASDTLPQAADAQASDPEGDDAPPPTLRRHGRLPPPDVEGRAAAAQAQVTLFDGMKRSPWGVGCTPANRDSLRAAAAESRSFTRRVVTMRWLRPGDE